MQRSGCWAGSSSSGAADALNDTMAGANSAKAKTIRADQPRYFDCFFMVGARALAFAAYGVAALDPHPFRRIALNSMYRPVLEVLRLFG
jgi:exonuclease I